ncbi:hypothetical protein GUJ93_ZPchr0006g41514 [Zizania palustris]|uniref:Homeobox domain-containing protein n=1 Tax=Zizania palustris TaxID=103762 RepID=A0A8J5TAW0_ZIZPA|nr:hypothetical protein GUJ93_ZPchr0006g41514 [Zizania palustris]
MEGEDLGTWLALGIGGGCCDRGGDRRPSPVRLDELFRQHVKEETRGCDDDHDRDEQDPAGSKRKGEKCARQRMGIGADGSRRPSRVRSPSDSRSGGGGGAGAGTRKKLQLTKEQSALLEDSFRVHNILSHAQKHDLARQLKLKPRQVEVWFQNRRARTKLKQTEVDCELLKRYCESLTDENQRLKHELMDLQRLANVCPSCETVTVMSAGAGACGEPGKSSSCSS